MGRRARGIRTGPGSGAADVRLAVSRRSRAPASRSAFGCGRQAPRSAEDLGRLPSGTGQARGGASRRRRSRTERTAVLGAERPRCASPPCSSVSAGSRRRKGGTRKPSRVSNGLSHCSRSSVPRTMRWPSRTGRPANVTRLRAELQRHAEFGARWPALRDPILETVDALRQDPGALIKRGTRLADAGDLEGAIAAHEAALARDPSLAQAHENLISLYGRTKNWAKGEEHYDAVARLGGDDGGCQLRLRRAPQHAGEVGTRRGGLSPGDRAQSTARARAQQSRTDPRAPAPVRCGVGGIPAGRRQPADASNRAIQSRTHAGCAVTSSTMPSPSCRSFQSPATRKRRVICLRWRPPTFGQAIETRGGSWPRKRASWRLRSGKPSSPRASNGIWRR